MSQKRLSIRLSESLHQKLGALSSLLGRSESEIVRDAIDEFHTARLASPTCFDVARRAGIIGCATALPADLSANPNHMAGFARE